jgi:hypothetical protein
MAGEPGSTPEQVPRNSQTSSPFVNPVFLTAFIGAVIAALANAYVAYTNNNTQLDIESHKESEEQVIEERKAEFSRLLEISKLDVDAAKQKVAAFIEMGLITDPRIVVKYNPTATKNTANAQNKQGSPANNLTTAQWESGWVGGGHNQEEMCAKGVVALSNNPQFTGKTITRLGAGEDSRKDIFGHVEYNYHCNYGILPN